jgi:hypothetical protein
VFDRFENSDSAGEEEKIISEALKKLKVHAGSKKKCSTRLCESTWAATS